MAGVILVPGTHGWSGFGTRGQWWQEGSAFTRMLTRNGVQVLPPFVWTTSLSGLWWTGRDEWETAALNLCTHVEHYRERCDEGRVAIVSHSHGSNVVALAAAMGWGHEATVQSWVSVSMPVRHDLRTVYSAARAHVRHWLHLFADGDRWQWLGGLMDGRLGVTRDLELAPLGTHTLVRQRVDGVGHGDVLRTRTDLWESQAWVEYLK